MLDNSSFNKIGVKSVVNITTITIAGKRFSSNSPALAPFCATIKETSPLAIIPVPIAKAVKLLNLQSLAPIKQPIIFVKIATIKSTTAKTIIFTVIPCILVFIPMLAKNIGENIK